MAVPCDLCLDVSSTSSVLFTLFSKCLLMFIIITHLCGIHGIYRRAIPGIGVQLWRLLGHATYECNLQDKIVLINVSAACHIIIIPPQKTKEEAEVITDVPYCGINLGYVGQWERSVIVMCKGTLKDKCCSNVHLLFSFGIGKDK